MGQFQYEIVKQCPTLTAHCAAHRNEHYYLATKNCAARRMAHRATSIERILCCLQLEVCPWPQKKNKIKNEENRSYSLQLAQLQFQF